MVDDGDIQNKICFFCMEKQFKEEQEKIQSDNHLNDLLSMMENASKEELIKGGSGCGKAFSSDIGCLNRKSKAERRNEAVSKAISKRILDLCNEYGYTVNYLSELSGVTQSTVNDIVNCRSKNVGIVTIKKLCEGLCITLEDFFTDPLFREYQ